jgi:hypothetical protein
MEVVNPKPFLASLTGKPVVVRLKWGLEYKGTHNLLRFARELSLLFWGSALCMILFLGC